MPVVATSQVSTAFRAQPQQATCLVDAGALVPDATLFPASYGCSEDLAAIRQVPAVQTCCSTTYGGIAAANGPGSAALTREIKLAPMVRKAPPQPAMYPPVDRRPSPGSITSGTSGCSVGLQVARMVSTTCGSLILRPRNGHGSVGPRGQQVLPETTEPRELLPLPMCPEPDGSLPPGATSMETSGSLVDRASMPQEMAHSAIFGSSPSIPRPTRETQRPLR